MMLRTTAFTFALSVVGVIAPHAARADTPTADACATAAENAQRLYKALKLHAAKAQLLICVDKGCPSVVRDDCAMQLNEIEKTTPTLVFAAKDAAGTDLTTVAITMDGVQLADHLDGSALSVDPGKHRFVFKTLGSNAVVKDLLIQEGVKDRHENIVFEPGGADSTPSTPASDSRWPAYGAFGVGAVGIVVGSIFGVLALNTKSTLDSECPSKSGCPQSDIDALSRNAWISNVGFAVGLVGAGVGTGLLLTSGGKDRPSVSVSIGVSQVGLVGTIP
jgi:hypothetical protein